MSVTMKASQATAYNDTVVRQFAIMTVVYGVVGMLVGVIIAAQLAWPELNLGIEYLSFGRLRPLHTNAVIFAFGGSGLFATSYYVVQRTCQTRLISDGLAAFTFWGWNLVIVLAVVTLPLGLTQSKEYAELIWPVDVLIAVVWVAYAIVFFGTVGIRKVRHIYVANWFYGAFILGGCDAAHRKQRCCADQLHALILCLRRCSGCHGAMVVRPQCCGLLPDCWFPGHDVLLHPQASRPSGLLLSPVHRPLLGADLHIHVGRSSPLALHRIA
jgi:hypothetical protein